MPLVGPASGAGGGHRNRRQPLSNRPRLLALPFCLPNAFTPLIWTLLDWARYSGRPGEKVPAAALWASVAVRRMTADLVWREQRVGAFAMVRVRRSDVGLTWRL